MLIVLFVIYYMGFYKFNMKVFDVIYDEYTLKLPWCELVYTTFELLSSMDKKHLKTEVRINVIQKYWDFFIYITMWMVSCG